jgi:hypothetical protein
MPAVPDVQATFRRPEICFRIQPHLACNSLGALGDADLRVNEYAAKCN